MEQSTVVSFPGLALAPAPSLPDPEPLRPPTVSRRTPLDLLLWLADAPACDLSARTITRLNQLRRQHPGGGELSLRQRLENLALPGEDLPDALRVRVDIMDELLLHLSRAPSLNARSRYWFRRLDSTLLLYLVMAPDCLVCATHPLRETLDHLAWLGVGDRCVGARWLPELEHRLDALCQGSSEYAELRATADFLKRCRDHEATLYERRLRCVRAAAEGQSKFDRARRQVEQQVQRLEAVPVCGDLLEHGWQDVLILDRLRDGTADGDHLRDLECLARASRGERPSASHAKRTLTAIRDGLGQVGVAHLPPQLERRLVHCLERGEDPEVRNASAARTSPTPCAQSPEPGCSPEGAGLWEKGVTVLQPGLWLLQCSDAGLRVARLAWRDRAGERFVFVSASGERIGEYAGDTVAARLDDRQWCLDPDWRDGSLLLQSMMTLVRERYQRRLNRYRHGALARGQRELLARRLTPLPQPFLERRPFRGLHRETRVSDRDEAIFVYSDDQGRRVPCGEWLDAASFQSCTRSRELVRALLAHLESWPHDPESPTGIGIPVPALLLADDGFVAELLQRLHGARLPADRIWLDIRGISLGTSTAVAAVVERVRELGGRVCLSTLAPLSDLPDLLARIPADVVRINGQWRGEEQGEWLMETITGLCHLYGMEVMVDGIAPGSDLAPLRSLALDYVQYAETCHPA